MKMNILLLIGLVLLVTQVTCQSEKPVPPTETHTQRELIGGPCEICSDITKDMPVNISATDTSIAWHRMEPKLKINGKVYAIDGQTPVPDCLIYYWQTNEKGLYELPEKAKETSTEKMIRGWAKTDAAGNYTIYTARPQSYPNRTIPAHIHLVIQEPNLPNAYYIDSFVFDDDPLLTAAERRKMPRRGGSGVLRLLQMGEVQLAEHNIILGLNIPGHPASEQ